MTPLRYLQKSLNMTSTSAKPYNLFQLTSIVARGFHELFWEFDFWCTGEVSRCSIIKWKAYLDLVQTSDTGIVEAKSRAIILQPRILMHFLQETKIKSTDLVGMKILFSWRVTFHIEYGYSVMITALSDEYVSWQIKKQWDDVRQKLLTEKIATRNHSTSLWLPPLTIAVISSKNSQWRWDVQAVLDQSLYTYHVEPYYCAIHGNDAKEQVLTQLKAIWQEHKAGKKIDLVLIVRGGWWSSGILRQNDENIVRGVCYMPVPVFVAVWHSSDMYLLDKAAKVSCKTPTDAAYLILREYEYCLAELDEILWEILWNIAYFYEKKTSELDDILWMIRSAIENRFVVLLWNVNKNWDIIQLYDPVRLLEQWYALLSWAQDSWWQKKHLTREDVLSLESGAVFSLSVYDQTFDVTKI